MTQIKSINEIKSNTSEGRYLLAAIAMLTTESRTNKTPDQVLSEIDELSSRLYPEPIKMSYDEILEFTAKQKGYVNWKTYNAMSPINEIENAMKEAEELFNNQINIKINT